MLAPRVLWLAREVPSSNPGPEGKTLIPAPRAPLQPAQHHHPNVSYVLQSQFRNIKLYQISNPKSEIRALSFAAGQARNTLGWGSEAPLQQKLFYKRQEVYSPEPPLVLI